MADSGTPNAITAEPPSAPTSGTFPSVAWNDAMSARAAMARTQETVTEPQFDGFSGRTNLTIRSTAVLLTGLECPAVSAEWRVGCSVTKACHPRRHAEAARGSPLANRDAGSNTGSPWRGRKRDLDPVPRGPAHA